MIIVRIASDYIIDGHLRHIAYHVGTMTMFLSVDMPIVLVLVQLCGLYCCNAVCYCCLLDTRVQWWHNYSLFGCLLKLTA